MSNQPQLTPSFLAPGSKDWRELNATDPADKSQQEEARKASDELKNLLLASLQMQHLVVLAGSGSSRSAGGPSMGDLWNGAVGETPSQEAQSAANTVNHNITETNIEAFLSRVEAHLQVREDASIRQFLDASKQVILAQCSTFLDAGNLEDHKTFLHRLSRRRARDQRLQLFTTNYDLCFERAAAALGGVALDGFSFTSPRLYDPRFFDYDIIRRPRSGDDLGQYLEGVFLLYKLHGSVNWARRADGVIYEKDKPTPAEACLIYPAQGKYQQSFAQPHLETMARYMAAVREPNTCLVTVGFGFNDDHLSEPLLAAVQSNPHLRLIVVDREAYKRVTDGNAYWKRLLKFSEQGDDVWFINESFGGFAQRVPDLKALTPADNLMRAIKGVAREA